MSGIVCSHFFSECNFGYMLVSLASLAKMNLVFPLFGEGTKPGLRRDGDSAVQQPGYRGRICMRWRERRKK